MMITSGSDMFPTIVFQKFYYFSTIHMCIYTHFILENQEMSETLFENQGLHFITSRYSWEFSRFAASTPIDKNSIWTQRSVLYRSEYNWQL